MNKIERFRAAVSGADLDRPPFTVWYHFGLQHAPADRAAQAHLEFFEAYDLDWLKVMNDYSYPMPDGLETFSQGPDLARLQPFDPAATPLGQQLRLIEQLAAALAGQALFLDTVFNAWNTLRRNLVKGALDRLMVEHPSEVEAALAVVNENLIRYARASLERGSAGIFFSVPASAEFLTPEQFERFMRPYDLAFLEAIRGYGECQMLHAHGNRLYLDRLFDYPVQAISWSDRTGGPSLAEMRARTPLALVGGIVHERFAYIAAADIRAQVADAVAQVGRRKLLLAPGCSIPTYSFPELIRAARDEAVRAGSSPLASD